MSLLRRDPEGCFVVVLLEEVGCDSGNAYKDCKGRHIYDQGCCVTLKMEANWLREFIDIGTECNALVQRMKVSTEYLPVVDGMKVAILVFSVRSLNG